MGFKSFVMVCLFQIASTVNRNDKLSVSQLKLASNLFHPNNPPYVTWLLRPLLCFVRTLPIVADDVFEYITEACVCKLAPMHRKPKGRFIKRNHVKQLSTIGCVNVQSGLERNYSQPLLHAILCGFFLNLLLNETIVDAVILNCVKVRNRIQIRRFRWLDLPSILCIYSLQKRQGLALLGNLYYTSKLIVHNPTILYHILPSQCNKNWAISAISISVSVCYLLRLCICIYVFMYVSVVLSDPQALLICLSH